MPVRPVSADGRAGEVVAVVGAAADRHGDLPVGFAGVAGEWLDSQARFEGDGQPGLAFGDPFGPGAQGDVDVGVHGAVFLWLAVDAREASSVHYDVERP